MRRHPTLVPLSDDHHQGLVQARHLSLAGTPQATLSPRETAAAFLRFWTEDGGQEHFRLEEEVLFPAYQRQTRAAESNEGNQESPRPPRRITPLAAPIMQVLAEHVYIRGLVAELADSFPAHVDLDLLHTLGEALHDHIRLEEQAVFPLIEESLPDPVLARLAPRLESPHYLARKTREAPPPAKPAEQFTPVFTPGLSHERTYVVEPQHTAAAIHSGGIDGLSTPALLAWMESVAFELAEDRLPPGQSTVGVAVNLQHIAPAPVGTQVRVRATLTGIEGDGRRLNFSIEASDHVEVIGRADHQRFIIDRERFNRRLDRKRCAPAAPGTPA